MKPPKAVKNLTDVFEKLPGIGPRTAMRLVYYLVSAPPALSQELAKAAASLKSQIKLCSICKNIGESQPCEICSDKARDKTKLCVVEEPQDLQAVESAGIYRGQYHVLHGRIAPTQGLGPKDIFLKELVQRVKSGQFAELILATNADTEGETTAMYIARLIKPTGIKITRLAQGIPTGGDIEYADEITLKRAFEGRIKY